jgi:hypothetical protein
MKNKTIDELISNEEAFIKEKLNLNRAKQRYSNIKIPQAITATVDKALEYNHRSKRNSYRIAISIPMIILCLFILFVNISTPFRDYFDKVPMFSPFIKLVKFDKGIKKSIENGFSQDINQSSKDKGISVTISKLVFDRRKMLIAYSFESEDNNSNLDINQIEILGKEGKSLEVVKSYGNASEDKAKGKKSKSGNIEIYFGDDKETFPKEITLKIFSFRDEKNSELNKRVVNGEWSFSIELNEDLLKVQPKTIIVNKEVVTDKLKFNLKELKIYPTMTDLRIVLEDNNKNKIANFKNARLVDDKGRVYNNISGSGSISDLEYMLHFESSYFEDFNSLSLEVDGIYYMPRKEQFIDIDLINKKIIDSADYKLELTDITTENHFISSEDGDYLKLGFMVTDNKFYDTANKEPYYGALYLQINGAFDENNILYDTSFNGEFSMGEGINNKFYVFIKKTENMPERIKLKVFTTNKDITAPLKEVLK